MTIPLSTRFDILQRDSFTCRFCGKRAPETELEVDHIHPRSKGGSDDLENLVTACRDCNRGKGDRLVDLSPATDWGTLVGKWFHTFDADGYVRRQGYIKSLVPGGYAVVQTFDWFTGSPFNQKLVEVVTIARDGWALYASGDDMREAHEYGYGGIRERPVPKEEPPRARSERNGYTLVAAPSVVFSAGDAGEDA